MCSIRRIPVSFVINNQCSNYVATVFFIKLQNFDETVTIKTLPFRTFLLAANSPRRLPKVEILQYICHLWWLDGVVVKRSNSRLSIAGLIPGDDIARLFLR